MKSLYSRYVNEKYGQEVLETEHAMVVYKVDGVVCSIELIYTVPEKRRSGEALKLMWHLTNKLSKDVKYLACEVDMTAFDAHESYAAIRSYGFEPLKVCTNNIKLVKYI